MVYITSFFLSETSDLKQILNPNHKTMKKINSFRVFLTLCFIAVFTLIGAMQHSFSQVVRAYGAPIFSDNLHGGHTLFGNTITAIYTSGSGSTGVVNTTAMNNFDTSGTGSYTNSRTSAYSNNSSNIQFVDVDGGGGTTSLLAYGGLWRYYSLNNYAAAPADISALSWTADNYNDAADWTNTANNTNAFGFNETNVNSPTQTNRSTYYLIRDLNITNPSQYSSITLTVKYDDGAIIYVNGAEVARMNMPAGAAPYATNPSNSREFSDGDYILTLPTAGFVNGNNQIAVALYNRSSGTNDFYFDMKLDGIIANETFNSSSADLILPAGSNTIKFARLYWGGRIDGGTGVNDNLNLRTAKIRKGVSGPYFTVTAPVTQIDKSLISAPDSAYQSYADVTDFLNTFGSGTYTVADITAATGSASAGNYAAWSIVVVYENPAISYNSVRVYDGFLQVYNGGAQTITLTGLNVPSTPLSSSDAYMSTLTWEGDANLAITTGNPQGDYIKVNNITASAGVNRAANYWNGTISKNGSFITTKNPDFKNQMSIDIDEIEVGIGYGITANATQVVIEFGSEADQYFPSLLAFTIRSKDPDIIINKSVSDGTAPFGSLQTNEILTYTLSGSNIGTGNALNCTVVDTIPSNVTYVPGSLIVVNAPGFSPNSIQSDAADTDFAFKGTNGGKSYVKFYIGTGKTNTTGGTLLPSETYTLRFQVLTPATQGELSSVINTARITGENVFGDQFVDDGTASMALGAPLPVTISFFSVKKENSNAILRWTTEMELNSGRFEVERSVDGLSFVQIGTVTANGNSTIPKNYSYPDALVNITSKIAYYRLRIVDLDGRAVYSKIIAVRMDGSIALSSFHVYPNPFTSNIKLQIQSVKEEIANIRLINMSGVKVADRKVTLQKGENIVVIKDLESVAAGIYLMEIRNGEELITQKVIKN